MKNLELRIVNLFMWGETYSCKDKKLNDKTIIRCDGFTFEFIQCDITQKHKSHENERVVTTTVKIQNITEEQKPQIFEIIDDICWLLSFAQQSPVRCETYHNNSPQLRPNSDVKTMRSQKNLIDSHGLEIRKFIEQVYPTFKQLKSSRQLTVVFDYLCEANHPNLALEVSLILHYVLIENLKHTFALEQGYKEKSGKYFHPQYPPQNHLCINKKSYCFNENIGQYIHKKYGQCGTSEMTKRMFEDVGISREITKDIIEKRNTIIHEGILLPFNDPNYSKQAREDLHDVSDLIRKYLLTLLNYKGNYYLSRD